MRQIATVAAAGLLGTLTGTAALAQSASFGPADTKETYYWISQNATLPLFVRTDYKGMEKVANELGVAVRIAGPTTIDLQGFIAAIDQVCAQKPAGVTIVGWDPALAASVDNCIDLKVPTVVDDADLPNSKRLTFIGTDWYTIGQEQAKALVAAIPDGGKIATLSIVNADNMQRALAGFKGYLDEQGGKYEIVANEDDNGGAQIAAQVTASLIAAHPDIKGFAGFDSESGAGIVTALNEAGLAGKVAVTAMEQTPEFFNTLKDGTVNAIIVQNRELFTYYAIKMLYDFNHNGLSTNGLTAWDGKPIPVNINTGVLVMTKDNIDAMQKSVDAQN